MKSALLFIFLVFACTLYSHSPFENQKHLIIQAEDYLCLDKQEVKEDETLEIVFSKPNGKALWTSPAAIELKGSVIVNGTLEINTPSAIIVGTQASINSLGLKLHSEETISYQGNLVSSSSPVYFISPKIELSESSSIDTSGDLEGGPVFIGGGWHGRDADIPNSNVVSIPSGSTIITDAKDGKGGDVVIWSNQSTIFLGAISAKGKSNGGNVEVSSGERLLFDGYVEMSSTSGSAGTLLIDPATITIQASGPDIDGLGLGHDITTANELSNPATFPGVNSIITSGAVDALLTGGVSMTLSATNSITVNSPISAAGAVTTLTFNAPTLFFNQPINLPFGGTLDGTAPVVNVGPSGIIQNGVDAVSPGGIVNLATATYVQEVFIGKNLTLNGSGIANTSIVCPTTPTPLNNTFIYTINGATYHPIILAEGAPSINIQNLTVDGNSQPSNFLNFRFVGIGYHNAGGTTQNTKVTNIEDSFPAGPTQHGFAIFCAIDTGVFNLQVLNNTIDHFQKQAITLRGPTLTALASGNTIIGEVPPSAATMNGIVVQDNALVTILNNTISNIISATPGVDSVGIFLINAAANSTVSNNSVTNSNIAIFSLTAGNNLDISHNTIQQVTTLGIYVQDTAGLTKLSNNTISCDLTRSNSIGLAVLDPDTGLPKGRVFLGVFPKYNMYLLSSTNQPYQLNSNIFNPCDIGLAAEGTGTEGPQVSMNLDVFNGTPTLYIQLINNPNDIWPTTANVSLNGLVSGFITFEQFLEIQSRLQGNFQDPALGIILEFLQPLNPEPPKDFFGFLTKDKFLNKTEYCLEATWNNSPSPNVVAYRIYFKGRLVKQIPASAPNVFTAELKHKKDALLYTITAVNSFNLESTPIPLKVIND